jgi:hypothetical protein
MFDPDVGGEDLVLQILYTHTHTHSDKEKGEKDLTAVGRTTPKIYTTTTTKTRRRSPGFTRSTIFQFIYHQQTKKRKNVFLYLFIRSILSTSLKLWPRQVYIVKKRGGSFEQQ